MKLVYSDRYAVDIGAHIFPIAKFARIRLQLAGMPVWEELEFVEPAAASWEHLALVHTDDYLDKLRSGRLSIAEQAEMELQWSSEVVEGFRAMAGGTIAAGRLALEGWRSTSSLEDAIVVHVGGGLHHAFPDHGEGFCMFNDVAIAIRVLAREAGPLRVAVVDCDVHHGNGTAAIFAGDSSVFTFSIHQRHNFPAVKPSSSLDVGLADGAGDAEYLYALEKALPQVYGFDPEMVFYLAGADPFEGDQLGGLNLSLRGLRERDRMVLGASEAAGVPTVVTLAGGYARRVEDTVAVHVATVEEALEVVRRARRSGAPRR